MVLENPVIFHLISCVDQNSNIHTDSRFRTHQAPRSFIRRERGVGGVGGAGGVLIDIRRNLNMNCAADIVHSCPSFPSE